MLFFRTVLLIVLATVMIPQTSCGLGPPDAGQPPIEIAVHQREGEVSFEFFFEDKILFFIKRKDRIGVSLLVVRDPKGETIWLIETLKPDPAAHAVKYGVVPDSYRQVIPRGGDPSPLKNNATYEVGVSWGVIGGRATFVYQGGNRGR
jgi:hypothetical protein